MTAPQQTDEFDADEVIGDLGLRIANLEANLAMQRSANRKLRAQLDELRKPPEEQPKK